MSHNPMRKDPWQRRKNLFSSPVPKAVSEAKIKWRILPILWLALKRTCTFLGAVVLFFTVIAYMNFAAVVDEVDHSLPSKMVLHITFDGAMTESAQRADFTDPFAAQPLTLKSFLDAIERAKYDPRVKGIYAQINSAGYSLTHLMEMRAALEDFKESGKFTYLFASSLNEGLGSYYLAQGFDQIWMQPMGTVTLNGISMQIPYIRSVLDKVGIEPQFFQRKEYKSAYESITNKEMSAPNREAMEAIIDDIAKVLSDQLIKDLNVSEEAFQKIIDQSIFIDQEALNVGLVDRLAYADEIADVIGEKFAAKRDGKSFYVGLNKYITEMKETKNYEVSKMRPGNNKSPSMKKQIALINVEGQIIQSQDPAPAGSVTSHEVAQALRTAADDKTIAAVVLRVNSPGGSPIGSETILRAVEKLKEKKKPVIVSMSSMAASGGYWVSAYADHIFAMPLTLTGSIGVLGGKVSIQGLLSDLGVNVEYLNWGENAAMWSMTRPFTQSEAKGVSKMMDNIYEGFVSRVSKGRNMSAQDVEQVARGRPWTGMAAKGNGLVDSIGGLNDALDYAAQQIGFEDRYGANIVVLPKPLSKIEQFIELLEGQVSVSYKLQEMMRSLEPYMPMIKQVSSSVQIHETPQVYAPVEISQ